MIKYGFQTYTWQMSFGKYAGKISHIADVANQGALSAIEAEICMLKEYFDFPDTLKELLAVKGVELAALCLVCDWLNDTETFDEMFLANKAIDYAKKFQNTVLVLCQAPQKDRKNLNERQKNALLCINNIAERAHDKGIICTFHPNSPEGSVFRTFDDYNVMFNGLDNRYIGFAADSGHIIKGGMNVYDIFMDYISFIKHVHFKDIDSDERWTLMGKGITDFKKIIEILKYGGYNGYIMIEDESPEAEKNPDKAALQNAKFIKLNNF